MKGFALGLACCESEVKGSINKSPVNFKSFFVMPLVRYHIPW